MAETSLNSFEPIPLPASAIVPLNFDENHTELPPTHVWSSSYIENHQMGSICVPVIDISNPNQETLDQIRHSCEKWGFFQVINHGVPETILDDLKTQVEELFSLPMEVKSRVLRSPTDPSGYGGLPIAQLSPNRMWHEGFGIQNKLHEHALKLWPSDGNPNFCKVMDEYQKTLQGLAERVLTLMLASVGLTPDDTNWSDAKTKESPFGEHGTHFQLNSYPICPNPERTMGLPQHADSSIITLLNQVNDLSGLQVLYEDKWVNVHPIPSAFVINSGDLAHILFNAQFVSPIHRVVPNPVGHRYSAAYFYGPPCDAPLAPLSKLVQPGSKHIYKAVTWETFLNAKTSLTVDKVYDLIRN